MLLVKAFVDKRILELANHLVCLKRFMFGQGDFVEDAAGRVG